MADYDRGLKSPYRQCPYCLEYHPEYNACSAFLERFKTERETEKQTSLRRDRAEREILHIKDE